MKIVELFAGSRSIGKLAEKRGHEVFSVDWENYDNIDLNIDIEFLKISDIPFIPDVVFASPDCATYSVAAIGHHRDGIEPKTEYAKKCDRVNEHFINLIKQWLKINPDLIFFIENPRGMFRKMPFAIGLDRRTVWYCKYGDIRAKPTDIFSNHFKDLFNSNGLSTRPECFNDNKNCHHEKSPRNKKRKGTQFLKNSYERSKLPVELCNEILNSLEK